MNKLQKKLASAIAAGALLANMALPVLAVTTIEISGNGSDTDNDVNVGITTITTVVQSNDADITNNVDVDADTGDNDANGNTGGDVSIETGDAEVAVGVSNTVNSNLAEISGCCNADAEVLISGNGADSKNEVDLGMTNVTVLDQSNDADVKNNVDADADTGDNDANDNTGGDVSVETGDAGVGVVILNSANSNSATIGGGSGGSTVSLRILGNGSDTRNRINFGLTRSVTLVQDNLASLRNDVDVDADTGDNDANDNTGGSVSIETGDAEVGVGIDNMANFNSADLNCGCLLDVAAKIAGNGVDSHNKISAGLTDARVIFQTNDWSCKGRGGWGFPLTLGGFFGQGGDCNDVDVDADTGGNDTDDNTGGVDGGDPSIETGDAVVEVLIENAGNANSVGTGGSVLDLDLPGGFSFNLNLSFSLADLLVALGLV